MNGTVLVHHKPGHFNGPPVIPEPGVTTLLMLGLIGLAIFGRKR